MTVTPTATFNVVLAGSAYPVEVTLEDALDPSSEAAKTALELGLLSDEDAELVRAAHSAAAVEPAVAAPETTVKKTKGKSAGAAPENKADGASD